MANELIAEKSLKKGENMKNVMENTQNRNLMEEKELEQYAPHLYNLRLVREEREKHFTSLREIALALFDQCKGNHLTVSDVAVVADELNRLAASCKIS